MTFRTFSFISALICVAFIGGVWFHSALAAATAREEAQWRALWKADDITKLCRGYWITSARGDFKVQWWEDNCKVWYGGMK